VVESSVPDGLVAGHVSPVQQRGQGYQQEGTLLPHHQSLLVVSNIGDEHGKNNIKNRVENKL
jgi:hypothetical protein